MPVPELRMERDGEDITWTAPKTGLNIARAFHGDPRGSDFHVPQQSPLDEQRSFDALRAAVISGEITSNETFQQRLEEIPDGELREVGPVAIAELRATAEVPYIDGDF